MLQSTPNICLFIISLMITNSVSKSPNIVVILTDDQDLTLNGMTEMPQTLKLIADQGMTFTNGFVSSPICCVSRASILSGRYVHNHKTVNNSRAGGCSGDYWQTQIEPVCFAPHIQNAGYNTMYAGKYTNTYGGAGAGGVQRVPLGWTKWFGLVGNSKYYNYKISNNGQEESFGNNYATDYYTDIVHKQGVAFLNNITNTNDTRPFLLVLSPPASHAPFTPAPQYNITNEMAPRIPNWNVKAGNTKHLLLQQQQQMNQEGIFWSDFFYSQRHGTLKSVDDMVAEIYSQIEGMNELNNTYFLFTSDHGFHLGQFGMGWDKRQLYENDIRIPYYWAGPGIKPGSSSDAFALNIDIAPTLVDIATGSVPDDMDGSSLFGVLNGSKTSNVSMKQQFLIEYYGEAGSWQKETNCAMGKTILGWYNFCDSWNNTYECIRMIDVTSNQVNGTIYCQFKCYGEGKVEVACDGGSAQSYGEYYELDDDFYELNNLMLSLNSSQKQMYDTLTQKFLDCKGKECNLLREG